MNTVEDIYVAVNSAGVALTALALYDAVLSRRVVRTLNGRARELLADAAIRRECLRLAKQFVLLSMALPSLAAPGDTSVNYLVAGLVALSVLLLLNTVLDTITRRRVVRILQAEVAAGAHERWKIGSPED